MDPPDPNARFVIADAPVNRRTADPQWRDEAPAPEQTLERARQLRQRHELGAPLADLLEDPESGTRRAGVPPLAVAALVSGTMLLPLAVLSDSPWAGAGLGAASLALLGFAGWRIAAVRRSHASAAQAPSLVPMFSPQVLSALDKVLDEVAPELAEPLLHQLLQLKHALLRVVELQRSPDAADHFGQEDRLYLQQCVKRYLPDSLLAYLGVPPAYREQPIQPGGVTPAQALASQLALIQQALARQEAQGVAAAGEALLRQQRFLQAKAGPPPLP